MLLQFILELLARFYELALPVIELFFNQLQFMLELHLMHCQGLNLSLQNVHPLGGDNRADIRNHRIREYLIDQTMIPRESGIGNMLKRIAIILIVFVLGRLDIDPPILLAAFRA